MVVLGIDPGSHRTGWGVISYEGSRLSHLGSGIIEARGEALADRLLMIADGLDHVLREHRPSAVSIENIFHAKNSQSALRLGHARGVALLCAVRAAVPVFEYTAGQIKQATTGRGRAEKEQVQAMVKLLLGDIAFAGLDASDALAAAICHAQMHGTPTAQKLRTATTAARRPARRRSAWSSDA